jgi:hypothetical protein
MTRSEERDLAIAAYEGASSNVRARFLSARRKLELAILDVQDVVEKQPEAMSHLSGDAARIFAAIARLGGVISGDAPEAAAQTGQIRQRTNSPFS